MSPEECVCVQVLGGWEQDCSVGPAEPGDRGPDQDDTCDPPHRIEESRQVPPMQAQLARLRRFRTSSALCVLARDDYRVARGEPLQLHGRPSSAVQLLVDARAPLQPPRTRAGPLTRPARGDRALAVVQRPPKLPHRRPPTPVRGCLHRCVGTRALSTPDARPRLLRARAHDGPLLRDAELR